MSAIMYAIMYAFAYLQILRIISSVGKLAAVTRAKGEHLTVDPQEAVFQGSCIINVVLQCTIITVRSNELQNVCEDR